MQEGYEEVEEVWASEDVDKVLLVQLKEFPDEDVELLSEVDLLHRVREVGLCGGGGRGGRRERRERGSK